MVLAGNEMAALLATLLEALKKASFGGCGVDL